MSKPTIIYIISDQRSGSTLLENILSKAPEIFSVGELRLLSDHINKGKYGKTWDWKCSCGSELNNCNFWSKVLNELNHFSEDAFPSTKIDTGGLVKKITGFHQKACEKENNKQTSSLLEKVYTSIFKNSDKNIIVDSSKHPIQGLCLYKNTQHTVKFIYLKRDLRAITFSKLKWQKKFKKQVSNPFKLLLVNKLKELNCTTALKYIDPKDKITITYKELAKGTEETINKVCTSLDIPLFEVPKYMYLSKDHTIAGTPNRFKKRKIKYDDSWELKAKQKPVFSFVGKTLNKF